MTAVRPEWEITPSFPVAVPLTDTRLHNTVSLSLASTGLTALVWKNMRLTPINPVCYSEIKER